MAEPVQILAETIINQPLPGGQINQTVEITYSAVGLPPRRVYLPKAMDTTEARVAAIKADLDLARKTGPTLLNIP
jgi:hypothetical protein